MKVLIVVDMQNDFIDGSLGTEEAKLIVPKIVNLIKESANKDTILLFTADTHMPEYLNTLEGKNLPVPHCITGTQGWRISHEIALEAMTILNKYNGYRIKNPNCFGNVIEKPTFGSIDLQNILYEIDDEFGVEEIIFVGVCTGICVLSNAILAKATLPEVPIKVFRDYCACVTPESHETALEAMKLCQIEIV